MEGKRGAMGSTPSKIPLLQRSHHHHITDGVATPNHKDGFFDLLTGNDATDVDGDVLTVTSLGGNAMRIDLHPWAHVGRADVDAVKRWVDASLKRSPALITAGVVFITVAVPNRDDGLTPARAIGLAMALALNRATPGERRSGAPRVGVVPAPHVAEPGNHTRTHTLQMSFPGRNTVRIYVVIRDDTPRMTSETDARVSLYAELLWSLLNQFDSYEHWRSVAPRIVLKFSQYDAGGRTRLGANILRPCMIAARCNALDQANPQRPGQRNIEESVYQDLCLRMCMDLFGEEPRWRWFAVLDVPKSYNRVVPTRLSLSDVLGGGEPPDIRNFLRGGLRAQGIHT